MSAAVVIRNVAWLVAWETSAGTGGAGRHVYRKGVDLAFEGGRIAYLGARFEGAFSEEVDGRSFMVMPGFVNVHAHPTSETIRKGVTDETLSPGFWHSSLYEHLPVFNPCDDEGRMASLEVALAELALSGVTTVVDLAVPFDGWLDALAGSGLRAVAAPFFRDARWFTRDGHSLEYAWDEAGGQRAFARARDLIDLARQHPSGRLDGMVCPAQVDTCGETLLRESFAHAEERDLVWTLHAAQSVTEFHEMHRRYGMTPIQWLDHIGVLGARSLIGHAIFLDHHPWLHWSSHDDLDLLAERGVSVAHCPTVFSRRGMALRSFGDYCRRGINLGIGTDTYPHNFIDEMRTAATAARLTAGTVADLTFSDVFEAGTVGGARALGRDDIGRIEVGARADLVCVDLDHPSMRPVRDPLRNLLVVAQERPIEHVFVDGAPVVRAGRTTCIDLDAALDRLQRAQQAMLATVPRHDWASRTAEELAPTMLEVIG